MEIFKKQLPHSEPAINVLQGKYSCSEHKVREISRREMIIHLFFEHDGMNIDVATGGY
jgi:hypothetical protein